VSIYFRRIHVVGSLPPLLEPPFGGIESLLLCVHQACHSPPQSPRLLFAHNILPNVHAAPTEAAANTVPHTLAEPTSSSWMLLVSTNPLMAAMPLMAMRRPRYEEPTKTLIPSTLTGEGPGQGAAPRMSRVQPTPSKPIPSRARAGLSGVQRRQSRRLSPRRALPRGPRSSYNPGFPRVPGRDVITLENRKPVLRVFMEIHGALASLPVSLITCCLLGLSPMPRPVGT
jgi:hypothetical protein